MDICIITALIIVGLLLFLTEVFLIPGLSLAGIASAGCFLYVNYYAFSELGLTGGGITLFASLCGYLLVFVWFVQSKTIDKLALKKDIASTVATPAAHTVKVGDSGTALTRLALVGNADINGHILEVRSSGGFIDEHTPIVVERIADGIILVRPLT